MTRQNKAYILGLTTIVLWSTVATVCKLSLQYISPVQLVFYSTITSCLVLAGVLVVQKKVHLLRTMRRAEWILAAKLGLLNPFLYYLVLFKAYDLLPAQQAQPINYTWAITLSILSVPFLGQKLVKSQMIAIFISYFGVLVISTGGNLLSLQFDSPLGVFLALLSTIFWAFYWIGNTNDTRDPTVGLLMNFLCAAPLVGLYVFFFDPIRTIAIPGVAGGVYLGFFEMGLSFLLWLAAMKLTKNTAKIANLIFLSPIISLVFIYLFVGEKILPATVLGLLLIIVGLVLQGRAKISQPAT